MAKADLADIACSIARTVGIVGERWTPLILRDLFLGITRFEDLRRDLGIASNVLTDRLRTLRDHEIVETRVYQENPTRTEYVLNLWKHKAFTFINIMGLSVGMTACFLIFLYVNFETGYDVFNTKADRIYRVVTDIKTPSDMLHWSSTSAPMAINMRKDFPEVESATRVSYSKLFGAQRQYEIPGEEHHYG